MPELEGGNDGMIGDSDGDDQSDEELVGLSDEDDDADDAEEDDDDDDDDDDSDGGINDAGGFYIHSLHPLRSAIY